MSQLTLHYLSDHPDLVPILAEWQHGQFGFLSPATSLEQRLARYATHTGHCQVPTTFVAHLDGVPVGCASLVANDMFDRPELTPWLASVYVLPDFRRQGIGAALVNRVVEEARALAQPQVYLYTTDRVPFYTLLGWQEVERRLYRNHDVAIMVRPLTGTPTSTASP
jgi:GNAT superfamily N-acetyltransferase